MKPWISIIIPTYNRKLLVERAIRSVFGSQFEDPALAHVEVLLVDDGSTDGTLLHLRSVFCEEIAQSRLKLIPVPHSGDPGVGRNRGIAASDAPYCAFLDSDDEWNPIRLARVHAQLVQGKTFVFESLLQDPPPAQPDWIRLFIEQNRCIASSAVISRDLFSELGGFPEGYFGPDSNRWLSGWEDYETWIRILLLLHSRNELSKVVQLFPSEVVRHESEQSAGSVGFRWQMLREFHTFRKTLLRFPVRYFPILSRKMAGALKATLLNG